MADAGWAQVGGLKDRGPEHFALCSRIPAAAVPSISLSVLGYRLRLITAEGIDHRSSSGRVQIVSVN
eukprot:1004378-Pyramimonas_sp.AAC.1